MPRRARRWPWLLLPLLVAAFLAWQFPAGWALALARAQGMNLSWSDTDGTLWRGTARQVRWEHLSLGTVDWSLHEWLPGTRTDWAVGGRGSDYSLDAVVALNLLQLHEARGIEGEVPAAWVSLAHVLPFVALTGRMHLDIDEARFEDGLPRRIEGRVDWNGAGLSGLVNERLGSIRMDFEPAGDGTRFRLRGDGSAPLNLAGEGQIDGKQWWLDLELSAAPSRMAVLEALAGFGRLRGNTLYLELSGTLLPGGATS